MAGTICMICLTSVLFVLYTVLDVIFGALSAVWSKLRKVESVSLVVLQVLPMCKGKNVTVKSWHSPTATQQALIYSRKNLYDEVTHRQGNLLFAFQRRGFDSDKCRRVETGEAHQKQV
eukprot:GABU01007716.1.p1 GENE.GABU01007716.1~~GABU01007716.1.p1  ORF type:complete len:118 (-),score=15.10 GABU01007716.1:63-416(-)